MNNHNKDEIKALEAKIEELRKQLDKLVATNKFLDPQVIKLSQTLDKLVTSHIKLSKKLNMESK